MDENEKTYQLMHMQRAEKDYEFNNTQTPTDWSSTAWNNNTLQLHKKFRVLSKYSVIFIYVNANLILFFNLVILVCLFTHRKNFKKNVFWHQIFCLCCNDIFVGIISLTVTNALAREEIVSKQIPCAIMLVLYFASQITTMCHLFGICIQRLLCVLNIQNIQNAKNRYGLYKSAVMQMLITLVTGFVFSIICIMLLPEDKKTTQSGCSVETAFGKHLKYMSMTQFIFLLLPLILTNVLYGISFSVLRKNARELKIQGTASWHNHSSRVSSTATCSPDDTRVEIVTTYASLHKRNIQKMHARATSTMGLVLFFLNLFMWPHMIQSVLIITGKRNLGAINQVLAIAMMMNSLINPFIYTIKLKEFRRALRDNIQWCCHACLQLQRFNNNEAINCVDRTTQTETSPTL